MQIILRVTEESANVCVSESVSDNIDPVNSDHDTTAATRSTVRFLYFDKS